MPGPSRPRWQVAGRRDPEQEQEILNWIQVVTGERIPPNIPYEHALRDGVLLCRVMNRLMPGCITRVNVSGGDYKFMDNIQQFLSAATKYGVPDVDLFEAADLYEAKNIALVNQCLYALGRTCYRHPEWRGPFLGPKPADENKRHFSEQQMRAGEAIIGLQAGSNKGATQSGQNFGASRKIIFGK
ncbi:muscle-specific protein 20 [Agrilus planipennis]|uniref:Transgelin n=1 Tax=Agrilus planipennis TaxID=224129 RepID=A0A1W4XHX6_AGRPL|nr:muscle-specific protein 20 [Agrilus planipennis]